MRPGGAHRSPCASELGRWVKPAIPRFRRPGGISDTVAARHRDVALRAALQLDGSSYQPHRCETRHQPAGNELSHRAAMRSRRSSVLIVDSTPWINTADLTEDLAVDAGDDHGE